MFTRSVLILVLAGVLTGAPALAQRPSKVAVDPVVTETMQQKMAILGRFVARSGGSVAARVAERVREIEVEVGDRVAAGAVLVRLANDRLAAQRQLRVAASRRAEAKAARMAAALAKAKQGLARLTKLRGSTADRPDRREDLERDVEKATSELSEARAEIDVAKAQLKLAQIALDDAVIRAPYSGVVTLRHVEVGTFVRTGEPVVTLLDDRDLEIEADVPAERLRGLTPNSLVEARLADG
ncbi:MAG: efflux RND transporter periplasmic adaptor subunit, partial [Pseudomonadota bacterium]|nr:efflux RND transporter periplasmic adaptor subunit [Pseudomonadota bacterium]